MQNSSLSASPRDTASLLHYLPQPLLHLSDLSYIASSRCLLTH